MVVIEQQETNGTQSLRQLQKDLRNAARTLSDAEARYLVDAYYTIQDYRKASNNQMRALAESEEPNETIQYFAGEYERLELQIKRVLDSYTDSLPIGRWAKSITGIGPVIAAGLIAHIDIHKAPTVGHIWNFAGLNPGVTWEKGQKRPWNAELKTLCWKVGESFVKNKSRPTDVYGKLYDQRKAYEIERNESGELADQAAAALERKKIGQATDAYKHYAGGKLPPAQIHARATRWTVKLFLSHFHAVWYELTFGQKPAAPYAIAQLGHAHLLEPPNWPVD